MANSDIISFEPDVFYPLALFSLEVVGVAVLLRSQYFESEIWFYVFISFSIGLASTWREFRSSNVRVAVKSNGLEITDLAPWPVRRRTETVPVSAVSITLSDIDEDIHHINLSYVEKTTLFGGTKQYLNDSERPHMIRMAITLMLPMSVALIATLQILQMMEVGALFPEPHHLTGKWDLVVGIGVASVLNFIPIHALEFNKGIFNKRQRQLQKTLTLTGTELQKLRSNFREALT